MEISDKILDYISKKGSASTAEIVALSKASKRTSYRHLNKLVADGKLIKEGVPPSVVYKLATKPKLPPKPVPAQPKETRSARPTPPAQPSTAMSNSVWEKSSLILAVVVLIVLTLGLLASSKGSVEESASSADAAVTNEPPSGVLHFDAATAQYYLTDSLGQNIILHIEDSAGMRQLIGQRIVLPPAFSQWIQEEANDDANTPAEYYDSEEYLETEAFAPTPALDEYQEVEEYQEVQILAPEPSL